MQGRGQQMEGSPKGGLRLAHVNLPRRCVIPNSVASRVALHTITRLVPVASSPCARQISAAWEVIFNIKNRRFCDEGRRPFGKEGFCYGF